MERGARQVYDAFVEHGLTFEQLTGPEMQPLPRIRQLLADHRLDDELRWQPSEVGHTSRPA